MNKKTFSKLSCGDIIKHKNSSETFTVISNYGKRITAVSTIDMTNPDEWGLLLKATYNKLLKTSPPSPPPPLPKRLIREGIEIIKKHWTSDDEKN